MNPIASFKGRVIQPWQQEHFEKTKYGKRIANYHDRYSGKRCFIVANGPSLKADDLTLLHEKHEITFAMNRIYKVFDQTPWRPTFYACEDPLIVRGQQEEITKLAAQEKFIPIELKWRNEVNIPNACYFHINYKDSKRFPFSFSTDCAHQIEGRSTVTFTCMQIAAYMGFSEIYLLGVDHNYRVTIDINGNTIIDPDQKDYFVDGYDEDVKESVKHDMGKNTRTYMDAQRYVSSSERTMIYNATRGGKLEVFPRIDFDSLF